MILPTNSLQSLRVARARTEFDRFVGHTWSGFQWSWHHRVICRKLDDLVEGRIKRLMIFAPPRHSKSELVSRRLPAYFLGRFPDDEVMQVSVTADLARRMNRDCQRIIDGHEYRQLFPHVRLGGGGRSATQGKAARTNTLFEISGHRGSCRSSGIGGTIVGQGYSLGIIDDPFANAEQALSATIRDRVWEWYKSTFVTRQAPNARILVTHTRWHHDDLAGRLLKAAAEEDGDQWEILNLPALSEPPGSPEDSRFQEGEALWPSRFDADRLNAFRKAVGPIWWDAQYQQRPTPIGGMLFRREWFGRFREGGAFWLIPGKDAAHKPDCTIFAVMDPACSEKDSSDWTAAVICAVTPIGDLLILEARRERLTPEKIPQFMQNIHRQWDCSFWAVEDNGFQTSIIKAARKLDGMPPIREMSHHGKGKVVRATPAIIKASAGEVYVPYETADWVKPFFDELELFRGADEVNDQVDAFAYAVIAAPQSSVFSKKRDEEMEIVRQRVAPQHQDARAAKRGLWGRS